MADNTTLSTPVGSGDSAVTREISHSGDTAKLQGVFLMGISGTEGSYTAAAVDGDAANGIDVDVTRVSGTVAVSNAGLTELAAAIDTEVQCDIVGALPAGNNNIGDVDVASIAAGDNNIGNVDVVTLPAVTIAAAQTLANVTTVGTITNPVAVTQSGTWDEVGINDSGNSITVDAPVGTPVYVRLSDGSSAIATLPVSLASVPSHAVTNAGTFVTQVDGAALTALQLIDDPVLADDAAFTPATTKVMMGGFEADETATDSVDEGDAGAARMTLDRKQIVTLQPHTAGGLSMASAIGTANTNATVVKNSAGQVYEIVVTNHNAASVYLKLYNKASTPDENDTPVWRMHIPGNTAGAGLAKTFPNGLLFSTGIAYRLVGGIADNSTTATAANEQLINVGYK